MNWLTKAAISGATLMCTWVTVAQPLRFDELTRLHTTTILGSQDPQNVPRPVVVRAMPRWIGRIRLDGADEQVLQRWVAELNGLLEEQTKLVETRYRENCASLNAGEIDATTLVASVESMDAENNSAIVASFDAAYDRLSPRGRNELDTLISAEILPNTRYVHVDYAAMAAIDNQSATRVAALTCSLKLTLTPEQIRQLVGAERPPQGPDASTGEPDENSVDPSNGARILQSQ